MPEELTEQSGNAVWFAYDGLCPVCTLAAQALRIKRDIGPLHLVDAREEPDHPLIKEINARALDLDEGMVLKYQEVFYHGDNALHMMALLGTNQGWFNRMNAILFSSKPLARFCYPIMRAARNLLLRLNGIEKIRNLETPLSREPIFKVILGEQWTTLPPVMQAHYMVRPYSEDKVVATGALDISISPFISLMAHITGMLIAYSGKNVPVTVTFRSGRHSGAFYFDRVFHYPGRGDIRFCSRMEAIGGNELVEFMGFGIGWRNAYVWDGKKMLLQHRGYVWRILGLLIPLPLSFFIGKAYAEETPISDDVFSMWTHIKHPLFGEGLRYAGTFEIAEISCSEKF